MLFLSSEIQALKCFRFKLLCSKCLITQVVPLRRHLCVKWVECFLSSCSYFYFFVRGRRCCILSFLTKSKGSPGRCQLEVLHRFSPWEYAEAMSTQVFSTDFVLQDIPKNYTRFGEMLYRGTSLVFHPHQPQDSKALMSSLCQEPTDSFPSN